MKLLAGLTLACFLLVSASCAIIHEGKFNSNDFKVLDGKTVELLNPHRANGKLKIIFQGGKITKIQQNLPNVANLEMNDDEHHWVRIQNKTDGKLKTTQFDFLWWHNLHNISDPEVCFEVGYNVASWFSAYLESDQPWPYNNGKPMSSPLALSTGSYGSNQLGPVVDNLFLTTDGFALHLTTYYPVYLRRSNDKHLCFTVHSETSSTDKTHFVSLGFQVFTGENIAKLHETILNHYHVERRVSNKQIPDERMFHRASYTLDTRGRNQSQILEQAKELAGHGLKSLQLVLVNWEAHYGDLTFDQTRFYDAEYLVFELHKLGFLVKLTVHSFVSETSSTFKAHQNLLLHSTANHSQVFTFTWPNNGNGALFNVFDYYRARPWIVQALESLRSNTSLDSYRFVGGELGTYGLEEAFPDSIIHNQHFSNLYSADFAAVGEALGKMVELDSGYTGQSWSAFIRLRDVDASWNALKSVIPTGLTMSLANYNFFVAPTFKAPPSEELYIRWLQAVTFFPSLQLPNAPWTLGDKATKLTAAFLKLREEYMRTIVDIAKHSTAEGRPLLRALWYLAPLDSNTYTINDQFALGSDIIVAPVLTQGQVKRHVYFPSGTWLDSRGATFKGPGNFTILAPLEELPYFRRQH